MPDTFTGSASVFGDPIVQNAYDTAVSWYLNDMVMFRAVADKRPVSQAMPSDSVTLTINGQLPTNVTPLNELLDVDAVAMPAPRQVTITVNEYGQAVSTTHRLDATAFTRSVIKDVGFEIAENLKESLDLLYKTEIDGATNKLYVTDAGAMQLTDPGLTRGNFKVKAGNAAVSLLRRRKASPTAGEAYVSFIHPDVCFDLRQEVGDAAWVNVNSYQNGTKIFAGEAGSFGGARYVETPRCSILDDANADLYNTYYFGREGLLEAVVDEPHVRVGPVTDKFARFRPIGWYTFLGVKRFRENALQIVRTSSSLATSGLITAYDPKA